MSYKRRSTVSIYRKKLWMERLTIPIRRNWLAKLSPHQAKEEWLQAQERRTFFCADNHRTMRTLLRVFGYSQRCCKRGAERKECRGFLDRDWSFVPHVSFYFLFKFKHDWRECRKIITGSLQEIPGKPDWWFDVDKVGICVWIMMAWTNNRFPGILPRIKMPWLLTVYLLSTTASICFVSSAIHSSSNPTSSNLISPSLISAILMPAYYDLTLPNVRTTPSSLVHSNLMTACLQVLLRMTPLPPLTRPVMAMGYLKVRDWVPWVVSLVRGWANWKICWKSLTLCHWRRFRGREKPEPMLPGPQQLINLCPCFTCTRKIAINRVVYYVYDFVYACIYSSFTMAPNWSGSSNDVQPSPLVLVERRNSKT